MPGWMSSPHHLVAAQISQRQSRWTRADLVTGSGGFRCRAMPVARCCIQRLTRYCGRAGWFQRGCLKAQTDSNTSLPIRFQLSRLRMSDGMGLCIAPDNITVVALKMISPPPPVEDCRLPVCSTRHVQIR